MEMENAYKVRNILEKIEEEFLNVLEDCENNFEKNEYNWLKASIEKTFKVFNNEKKDDIDEIK